MVIFIALTYLVCACLLIKEAVDALLLPCDFQGWSLGRRGCPELSKVAQADLEYTAILLL